MAHPGQVAKRDANYVAGLIALDSADATKTVAVTADQATGRLLVSATISGSSGDGAILDGVNATIKATVTGALALKVDGSAVTQPISYATTGSGTATGALRVELPTNGTGVIATVGAVTAITNALPAGSAIIGNVRIDQTTPGTTNAVSLAQLGSTTIATDNGASSAGTQRVTVANNSTGILAGVTTVTTVTNLGAANAAATIAADGVTPTVPGFASYGFIKTPGANTWDRSYSVVNATNSTGIGITAAGMVAQFDDVSPTAITENQFGNVRMSANRNQYGTIRDAAGNERGANVSAGNALLVDASATTQPVSYATTGSGTATGALRVEIANNGTGLVGLNTGSNAIGKLAANSGVIIGDVNVVSNIPGTGATALGKAEDTAHTTGDTGVMALGVRNDTLLDTTNTTADYTQISTDIKGRVMTAGAPRALKALTQTQLSNTTTETTIIAATASTFHDVYCLIFANTGATTTKVSIRDDTAGTVRMIFEVPTLETRGFTVPVDSAVPQTAVNKNWTAQCGSATTALEVTALYVSMV